MYTLQASHWPRYGNYRLSPVNMTSLCDMADSQPRGTADLLAFTDCLHVAFHTVNNVGIPLCADFEANVPYDPIA